jgi:hypothetical protein
MLFHRLWKKPHSPMLHVGTDCTPPGKSCWLNERGKSLAMPGSEEVTQSMTLFMKWWADPAFVKEGQLSMHSLGKIARNLTTLEKLVASWKLTAFPEESIQPNSSSPAPRHAQWAGRTGYCSHISSFSDYLGKPWLLPAPQKSLGLYTE